MLAAAWSPFSLPPLVSVWVLLKRYVAYTVTLQLIILIYLANANDGFPQLGVTVATSLGCFCFVRCVYYVHIVHICCCCMPLRRCSVVIGSVATTSACTGQLVGHMPQARHDYLFTGDWCPLCWMNECVDPVSLFLSVCLSSFWILCM